VQALLMSALAGSPLLLLLLLLQAGVGMWLQPLLLPPLLLLAVGLALVELRQLVLELLELGVLELLLLLLLLPPPVLWLVSFLLPNCSAAPVAVARAPHKNPSTWQQQMSTGGEQPGAERCQTTAQGDVPQSD
jgi:hypothetical protein